MLAKTTRAKRTVSNPTNWYVIDSNYKRQGAPHKTESDAQRVADLKNKAAKKELYFVISAGNEAHNGKKKMVVNSKNPSQDLLIKRALKRLGYNLSFIDKALYFWYGHSLTFRKSIKNPVQFLIDNEYIIQDYKQNPTTKKRINPLTDDKAIMLVKKLDRSASGGIDTKKLSTDEKASIRSHSSYFYITKDFTGDKVRLTEKAYSFLEKGIENKTRKAVVNSKMEKWEQPLLKSDIVRINKTIQGNDFNEAIKLLERITYYYPNLSKLGKDRLNDIFEIIPTDSDFDKLIVTDRNKIKRITLQKVREFFALVENRKNPTRAKANYSEFDFDYNKGLKDLGKMFQGKTNHQQRRVEGSDLQPNTTTRIGKLKKLVINGLDGNKYELAFDGEAFASMDRRKNLWFSGKDAKVTNVKVANDAQKCLGYLTQINYVTDKKHIENGNIVEYYHKFGEVNREKPTLWVDGDGFLIVNGGDYDVWKEGIVN